MMSWPPLLDHSESWIARPSRKTFLMDVHCLKPSRNTIFLCCDETIIAPHKLVDQWHGPILGGPLFYVAVTFSIVTSLPQI